MERIDVAGMFLLGLIGTGHCIGMCGPLIFALPGRTGRFAPHLYYHLGRAATYTMIGAVMGGIGQLMTGGAAGSGVDGVKSFLWLFASAFLLLFGLNRLGLVREPAWFNTVSTDRLPGFKAAVAGASSGRGGAVFFLIGAIFGFLPCGLSYGAFAQALGTASVWQGFLNTMAFAVGTAPGLILVGTGASALFSRYRRASDIIAGILMIFMGLKMGYKALRLLG